MKHSLRGKSTVHIVTVVTNWKLLSIVSSTKKLDDFWLRVTNTFKSCGISKLVSCLQYLVIGYKTELIKYKWINVLVIKLNS